MNGVKSSVSEMAEMGGNSASSRFGETALTLSFGLRRSLPFQRFDGLSAHGTLLNRSSPF
jgi:hypothetical protein